MIWLLVVALIAVVVAVTVVATGRGGAYPDIEFDAPVRELPEGELRSADIRGSRFAVTVRGYRMSDVDALLERLADQLEERERGVSPQAGPAQPSTDEGQ